MTKDEYKIYAEDLIQDMSNRIDELRQRSTGIDDKKRLEFDRQVEKLIVLRDDLKEQLNMFDDSSESGWEEAKSQFKKALNVLKEGFESLFSILSE